MRTNGPLEKEYQLSNMGSNQLVPEIAPDLFAKPIYKMGCLETKWLGVEDRSGYHQRDSQALGRYFG